MNMTGVDSLIDPELRSSLDLMQYSVSFLVSHAVPSSARVSLDPVTSWLPLLSPPAHAVYSPTYFVTCHLGIGPRVSMRRLYIAVTWKASSTWSFDHLTASFVELPIFVFLNTSGNASMLSFHSSNPSCTKLQALLFPSLSAKLTQSRTFPSSFLCSCCFPVLEFASPCLS